MISTKKHIQQLVAILIKKGISDVVISPGSRNGPLIHTLVGCRKFNCRNIVDERSAAYFAIGLSQSIKKPVVIVCSSGTATLNYAPAVAEAFYLKIPLIILTADRPEYWVNQGESQCIPQKNIYSDFVRSKVSLPLNETEEELWEASEKINKSLNIALSNPPGPVHINIPLEEPLHEIVKQNLPAVNGIECTKLNKQLDTSNLLELAKTINSSSKILILAGQQAPDTNFEESLINFTRKTGAVILREHLSNLKHKSFIGNIDTLTPSFSGERAIDFQPDLLITFGGQIVSKSIKQFLRKYKANHWQIDPGNEYLDTYKSLTKVIPTNALDFFKQILPHTEPKENTYYELWKKQELKVIKLRENYISSIGFSDLKVFDTIKQHIPQNSVLHLGNSSPVRYALICKGLSFVSYYGNRGTSGIDGCLSTAVGFASESDITNTLILGDLSFFYDSNGLWNNYLSNNMRIVVINNNGGNIFGLIKGPSDSPAFKKHFLAENNLKAEGLANTFNLDYFAAKNEDELETALIKLYSNNQKKAAILEVFTNTESNTHTFRELFKQVKKLNR